MMATEHHVIEAGFAAFANAQAPLSPELVVDLRIAFYAGARHLLSAITHAARTQQPLQLSDINTELNKFADECALRAVPCAGSA
jgi:hypothetical protein